MTWHDAQLLNMWRCWSPEWNKSFQSPFLLTSAALNWVSVVWSFVSLLHSCLVFQMSALFDCLLITFRFTRDLLMLLLLVHKHSTGEPVGGMFYKAAVENAMCLPPLMNYDYRNILHYLVSGSVWKTIGHKQPQRDVRWRAAEDFAVCVNQHTSSTSSQ